MIIEVDEIGPTGLPFEFFLEPEELETDPMGFTLPVAAKVSGRLEMRDSGVSAKGRIEGEQELQCTRCLAQILLPLKLDFEADLVTEEEFGRAANVELGRDELDSDLLEGGQIDLSALAREQVLLSIPEQIYCRPDCKGLCEKCGAELNLVDCNCDAGPADPRWAGLESLRDDIEKR